MEFRFEYVRQHGKKYKYHVSAYLMKHDETGAFAYSAVVHRGIDYVYVGPLAHWPLVSHDSDSAIAEAKKLIERDIEDLVGINE